jgi:hypothetical protein
MEKIVLSRPTYNRLSDGANIANDLLNKATSPKGIEPPRPKNRQYLAKLTAETTTPNGGLTWKAEEVYLDETGLAVVKTGGFECTDDNPVFTLNAATIGDVIMVSQAGRPAIDPDPAKRYWFGNPGGGGGGASIVWLKIKSKVDQKNYIADVYSIPNDPNPPIELDVPVYFYNVDYGDIPIDNYYQSQLVGSIYYAYAPTWGG